VAGQRKALKIRLGSNGERLGLVKEAFGSKGEARKKREG